MGPDQARLHHVLCAAVLGGKIEGKPGDTFTIEAGNKWPGTYKIEDDREIVTGDPLQYTEANYKEHAA